MPRFSAVVITAWGGFAVRQKAEPVLARLAALGIAASMHIRAYTLTTLLSLREISFFRSNYERQKIKGIPFGIPLILAPTVPCFARRRAVLP